MIKELEDHGWFPNLFRRYQAEYIGSIVNWLKLYRPLVAELQHLIDTNNAIVIQDLCSGSGIPAIDMHRQLKGKHPMILSDKFPVRTFTGGSEISYVQEEVDVLLLEPQPSVCYTMYNGFHHFTVAEQQLLIKKMVMVRNPFLIAEILTPGIFTMFKIIFAATLLQLFTAPFVKPFSFLRLFFTYIIPVNLFTVLYDGIISVVRSKTVNQYEHLMGNLSTTDLKISVDNYSNWKGSIVCIKGTPLQ